ncbi:MAG: carbon starvation protein A [Clostridiales bacterium]|jgi:carbon starvation protein CstA|nr:carbon starvation protein A [Clostridiales bacterium]
MISFFASAALLIAGYFTYGKIADKIFGSDDRITPAVEINDGVDFVPMSDKKIFLIQLLNIAGLGPIIGAIQGALWGPAVYLWIVLGSILAGGVHDFMMGMLSLRQRGGSVSEITGIYLGGAMKQVMRVFSVVLLLMVGTVFAVGPASLLASLTPAFFSETFWLAAILVYYFLATLLPIDKIIGKIYPVFGICLVIMVLGVGAGLIIRGYSLPEITLRNLNPSGTPIYPFMFITVACGAISGFHATQSPMMARCLTTEKKGRQTFYGAMIAEGIIALIWAAAGVTFYNGTGGLAAALAERTPNGAVYDICMKLIGPVGGVLAMLGVIVCPITSGDTAFRSARLTIADWFKVDQTDIKKRLLLTAPVLGFGAVVGGFFDYAVIWRYFSWSNQMLAMIVLWAISVYLRRNKKLYWIAAIPATFMSAVCMTYFFAAPECLGFMEHGMTTAAYSAGIVAAVLFLGIFMKSAPDVPGDRKISGEDA